MYPVMEKGMENKREQSHIVIKSKETRVIIYTPSDVPVGI